MKGLLALLAAFSTFFCSCQKQSNFKQLPKNTLNIAFLNDPFTLDPRKNSDPTSCHVISLLFDGLLQLNSDGSLSFALAQSLEITSDKTKYTFHLRKANWSDGHPITAHDFIYAWKTALDPTFPNLNAYFLYCIKNAKAAKSGLIDLDKVGVYALDDNTLVVKLEHPTPHFLKMLTFCTYFPIPKHIAEKNPAWPAKCLSSFVSNGAFTVENWQRNNRLVLTKNPTYWNNKTISLEKIVINTIESSLTSLALFQDKELDLIGLPNNPLPSDAIDLLKKEPSYFTQDFAGTECCFFNSQCFPLSNKNIRKALYYAINRTDIVTNITQPNQKTAYTLIPPILRQEKSTKILDDGSQQLALKFFNEGLKEIGINKDSFPKLVFSYYNSTANKKIALYLQETWKKTLGLKIGIEGLDVKSFLNKITHKNFHFCLMSIYAQYNDPYNYLERFLLSDNNKNYCSYENVKFQNILAMSNDTDSDSKREQLLTKAESLFLSELYCGPLFHCSNAYLKIPNLEGVIITPIGSVNLSKVFF